MVQVRSYLSSDSEEIMQLFYDTVHTVNKKDYNESQLDAWAPKNLDQQQWEKVLSEHYCVVAEIDNQIVGFCDIDDTGYLDHLFVHKDYQRRKIATILLNKIESYAVMTGMEYIITHVSITAKPFFIEMGFNVIKQQTVMRRGINFVNFIMQKTIKRTE